MANDICSGMHSILHPVVCHRVYNFILRILLLYNPPSPVPRGTGDFYFKSPGEPRGGEFQNLEYPGAPGVGDFLRPRGMGSLPRMPIGLVS